MLRLGVGVSLSVQPGLGGMASASVLLEGLEFPAGSHSLLLERFEMTDVELPTAGG